MCYPVKLKHTSLCSVCPLNATATNTSLTDIAGLHETTPIKTVALLTVTTFPLKAYNGHTSYVPDTRLPYLTRKKNPDK